MKKRAKERTAFAYLYPYTRAQFIDGCRAYCETHGGDTGYIFEQPDADTIRIGVGRGGHSGGFWYEATMSGNAPVTVSGRLEYRTFGGDTLNTQPNTRKQKILDALEIALWFLLLWPLLLLFWLYAKIREAVSKDKPVETPEERLVYLMTDVLCCKDTDAPGDDPT